jgi:hypothetical protein
MLKFSNSTPTHPKSEKYLLRLLSGYARRMRDETGKSASFMEAGEGEYAAALAKDVSQTYRFADSELLIKTDAITIDIFKANTGGSEISVLKGLSHMLARDRPLCIINLSATTRQHVEHPDALYAVFPKEYTFYYVSWAGRRTGWYMLAPFHYDRKSKIRELIACPIEKLGFLSD